MDLISDKNVNKARKNDMDASVNKRINRYQLCAVHCFKVLLLAVFRCSAAVYWITVVFLKLEASSISRLDISASANWVGSKPVRN